MNADFNEKNLIWIDLEMTGLDPNFDKIIEIATIVTDPNLNILAEGPVIAIHQSDEILNKMDDWCKNTHGKTGLIDRVKASKINENEAEKQTITFLENWIPKNCSPICGNTIGQDRRFLFNYMPELEQYFHYRYLDVSSIKEVVARWNPEILQNFKKNNSHKALDDIKESINELIFYRKNIFNF